MGILKLKQYLDSVCNILGICYQITLCEYEDYLRNEIEKGTFTFDHNFTLAYSPSTSRFCLNMIKHMALREKCVECDYNRIISAKKGRRLYIKNCHMGLKEAVLFLNCDNNHYIVMFGQVIEQENYPAVYENLKKSIEKYDIEDMDVEGILSKIPVIPSSELDRLYKLIETTIKLLTEDGSHTYASRKKAAKSLNESPTEHSPVDDENFDRKVDELFIDDRVFFMSTKEISDHLDISPRKACQMFKKHYGVGIKEFINLQKIKRAETLLLQTEKPIHEIYELCGFSNRIYFASLFKKITGKSPTQFRASV